tara:strand:- start:32173 stop:32970 length:798 start_codon:yes stop_codon:yes gene_type:complete
MKIHEVNATSMCPIGGKLLPKAFPSEVICHCLIIESEEGLILIDTGLSLESLHEPQDRLGLLNLMLDVQAEPEKAMINQIRKLGFSPRDVRHIIPTHLDNDHCEGIIDFPLAKVHTSMLEINNARNPISINAKARYRHFHEHRNWKIHPFTQGENWFGFKGVKAIDSLKDELLLIPLYGHTPGHFGVAVKSDQGWLLHAGDAYYDRKELSANPPLGMKLFMKMVHENPSKAQENVELLKKLHTKQPEIKIMCSHDPSEYPCLCQH